MKKREKLVAIRLRVGRVEFGPDARPAQKPGTVIEVTEEEAERLVATEQATYVEPRTATKGKRETATSR